MTISLARFTSAAGETRDRVNDTNTRRSSLVRLTPDSMPHMLLLKSMLHNTSLTTNGVVSLEIEYLSVRPERRRRAPGEFLHSVSLEMTDRFTVKDAEITNGF
jgi:hypothetical protein